MTQKQGENTDKPKDDEAATKEKHVDTWEELKPQGAYGIAFSSEVTLRFKEPIYLDSLYLKASKSYLNYFNSQFDEGSGNYATFSVKTYFNKELLSKKLFKASPTEPVATRLETWTKIMYPPNGFAKVNRIVLSRGLEVDNIKFMMRLDVKLNIVRLDASDMKLAAMMQ